MNYTPKEILSFVEENDVKFIRLAFTDINGNLKNIAIMPSELERAFEYGIPFESGFLCGKSMDLLLFPDISTLSVLPWRPKSGRVIRFFCNIRFYSLKTLKKYDIIIYGTSIVLSPSGPDKPFILFRNSDRIFRFIQPSIMVQALHVPA